MKKFAFISRHVPTPEQYALAKAKDVDLIHIGDIDAFHGVTNTLVSSPYWHGAVVEHPALALRLILHMRVGVFENGNRAAEGEVPRFMAEALHVYKQLII